MFSGPESRSALLVTLIWRLLHHSGLGFERSLICSPKPVLCDRASLRVRLCIDQPYLKIAPVNKVSHCWRQPFVLPGFVVEGMGDLEQNLAFRQVATDV